MNEIYMPLDPGIKDAVMLLRNVEINTSGSCDAKHEGHAGNLPWISIDIPHQAHFSLTRWAVVETLIKAGYRAFTVEEHYLYQKSSNPWKTNMIIMFWTEAKPHLKP